MSSRRLGEQARVRGGDGRSRTLSVCDEDVRDVDERVEPNAAAMRPPPRAILRVVSRHPLFLVRYKAISLEGNCFSTLQRVVDGARRGRPLARVARPRVTPPRRRTLPRGLARLDGIRRARARRVRALASVRVVGVPQPRVPAVPRFRIRAARAPTCRLELGRSETRRRRSREDDRAVLGEHSRLRKLERANRRSASSRDEARPLTREHPRGHTVAWFFEVRRDLPHAAFRRLAGARISREFRPRRRRLVRAASALAL